MKYISLILVMFFVNHLSCQTSANDSLTVQLSSITVAQDTISGPSNYKLVFKVTVQQLQNLKSLDLSILNQSNALVLQIGNYDLKTHASGFNYLETSSNEKKTILGNDIFFTKIVDQTTYNNSWKIKLNYTSNINIVKSVTNPISH